MWGFLCKSFIERVPGQRPVREGGKGEEGE